MRDDRLRPRLTGNRDARVEGVRCIAFKLPHRGMVAEVLNSHTRPVKTDLHWQGKVWGVTWQALWITTCLWNPPRRSSGTP